MDSPQGFEHPEWAEPVMVTINGTEFPTQSYRGVQRFVPDSDVVKLVNLALEHFGLRGNPSTNFYSAIPESLKALTHPNAVVNYMVARNQYSYFGLNELSIAVQREQVELADYIAFGTLHGYSVSGYVDSITSLLQFGLGLETENEIDAAFDIQNPLWA